jgi:spore coat polysaccharide biosynthesis protein SpsF (cytidylyltransferase family)
MVKRTVIVSQARTGSSRLPNKVLKEINGLSLLEIHIHRLQKVENVEQIIIATTENERDDEIITICNKTGVEFFRGSEDNVLERFWMTVKEINTDFIVRVTSDCPLIDPAIIDEMILEMHSLDLDYISNTLKETFPDGQDIEIFSKRALFQAYENATLKSHKEHVTLFLKENSNYQGVSGIFKVKSIERDLDLISDIRLTVDEKEDFEVIKFLINRLGIEKDYLTYSRCYLENNLSELNGSIIRNEGLLKSLNNEKRSRII